MNRIRRIAAVLVAAFALVGCKSPEEKLIDRRHRLRETLDELYGTYSGRSAAKRDGAEAPPSGVVGRLLAGVDRTHFDEYCLAVGRGERPFTWSDRLGAFMEDSGNARACRDAAELALEIETLEREVAPRGRER